jgi:hypothetical protein
MSERDGSDISIPRELADAMAQAISYLVDENYGIEGTDGNAGCCPSRPCLLLGRRRPVSDEREWTGDAVVQTHAYVRAATTLKGHGGSMYKAWREYDTGWEPEEVLAMLKDMPSWDLLDGVQQGKMFGVVLAFGALAIERDREHR